jgi:hypothetical protein
MRKLSVLLAVALLANAAGAMTLDLTDEGPLGINDGAGNPLAYVVVSVVGDSASEKPNAWDGVVSGPLHQLTATDDSGFSPVEVLSPTLDFWGGDSDEVVDSHFLVYSANLVPITAPYEGNDGSLGTTAFPPHHEGYDNGTGLGGIFADTTADSQTWDVAYLVGVIDTTVNINAEIGAPNFDKLVVDQDYTFVPEPATLSLLGLGGLATLIRRKR